MKNINSEQCPQLIIIVYSIDLLLFYCYCIKEDDDDVLTFSRIFTIAVLIPEIPVLNGNDPSGRSVIGFTHS